MLIALCHHEVEDSVNLATIFVLKTAAKLVQACLSLPLTLFL